MCVFLHTLDGHCPGGRYSYVTRQRLRSARLSHLASKAASFHLPVCFDTRHSTHGVGSLRGCGLSSLAEQQRTYGVDNVEVSVSVDTASVSMNTLFPPIEAGGV